MNDLQAAIDALKAQYPAWLVRDIAAGFQILLLLRLDSSPATDTIVGVLKAWLIALTNRRAWSEERDAERVRQGFAVLSGRLTRWPAPAQLLEAMPSPVEPRALPGPSRLSEVGRRELAKIKEMAAKCVKEMPRPGPEDYGDGPVLPLRQWAPTPPREEQLQALERKLSGGSQ
jgi:hypothetical protein